MIKQNKIITCKALRINIWFILTNEYDFFYIITRHIFGSISNLLVKRVKINNKSYSFFLTTPLANLLDFNELSSSFLKRTVRSKVDTDYLHRDVVTIYFKESSIHFLLITKMILILLGISCLWMINIPSLHSFQKI